MGLESSPTRVSDLTVTWPVGATDKRSTADDHLRNLKAVMHQTLQFIPGAEAESELTISSGSVTIVGGVHSIDTQGDASSDDLDTITFAASSVQSGAIILIRNNNAARSVVLKHGTGNISCVGAADITLSDAVTYMPLRYDGSNWIPLQLRVEDLKVVDDLTVGGQVAVDTVAEATAAAGVTIDGVLLKDSEVTTDVINEKTGAAGVTIDGFLLKDAAPDPTVWPSFAATMGGNQTLSSADPVKVQFDTETFDSNSDYDAATNYRFTPTAAGKYLITAHIQLQSGTATTHRLFIYKNGSALHSAVETTAGASSTGPTLAAVVEANGSTDYFEVYAEADNGSGAVFAGTASSFTGSRIA